MGLMLDRTTLIVLTFVLLLASMYMSIDNFIEARYQWRASFRRTESPHREWFMWLASISLTIGLITSHWLNPLHPDADTDITTAHNILAILMGLILTYITVRLAVTLRHRLGPLLSSLTLTGAILVIHFGANSHLDKPLSPYRYWPELAVYTLILYGLVTLAHFVIRNTNISSTARSVMATVLLSFGVLGYHDITSVATRRVISSTIRSHSLFFLVQDVHLSAVAQVISIVAILLILLNALVNRYLHRTQRARVEDIYDVLTRNQGLVFMVVPQNGSYVLTVCEGDLLYKMGLAPEDILGKSIELIFGNSERKSEWIHYCETAFTGEEVVFESQVRGVSFLTSIRPVVRNHQTVAVVGSSIETTSLKQAQQALSSVGQKYQLIVDNTSDLILILSHAGRIQFASASSLSLLGYSYEQLRGSLAANLLPESDRIPTFRQFRWMRRKLQPVTIEHGLTHQDGSLHQFESRCVPIRSEHGQVTSILVVGRDITERKRNEDMLRRSESLSVLGQLAAGMAHEIRNPLTSIRGFMQLLEEQQKSNPYWPIILNETKQIEEIVSEFLSLAKPQVEERTVLDLRQIIYDVQILLRPQATLNNTKVEVSAPDPAYIRGVTHQLKQVFTNIVKNAIEAIESSAINGLVEISVEKRAERVVVTISDNGPGIDASILERLGEPFYSTKSKGTGLGLVITNKIIQEHGGSLNISSSLGRGTLVEVGFEGVRVDIPHEAVKNP